MTPMIAPKKLALAEFAFALITEAAGESLLFVFAFGNRMRVGLLDDLNFVFCLAKKAIGLGQLVALRRSEMNLWLLQLNQRRQRARPAHLRFVAAVDQLHRLSEKFDLANAAVAEFEIALFIVAAE